MFQLSQEFIKTSLQVIIQVLIFYFISLQTNKINNIETSLRETLDENYNDLREELSIIKEEQLTSSKTLSKLNEYDEYIKTKEHYEHINNETQLIVYENFNIIQYLENTIQKIVNDITFTLKRIIQSNYGKLFIIDMNIYENYNNYMLQKYKSTLLKWFGDYNIELFSLEHIEYRINQNKIKNKGYKNNCVMFRNAFNNYNAYNTCNNCGVVTNKNIFLNEDLLNKCQQLYNQLNYHKKYKNEPEQFYEMRKELEILTNYKQFLTYIVLPRTLYCEHFYEEFMINTED